MYLDVMICLWKAFAVFVILSPPFVISASFIDSHGSSGNFNALVLRILIGTFEPTL